MNANPIYPASRPAALTPVVRVLLTLNVAGFLIGRLGGESAFFNLFGLTVPEVFTQFRIYQFITYLFVHGGALHLLFNMLVLYFFGRELEIFWGTRKFLGYYLICGVGAGICSLPFMWSVGVPLVGASGALFGLLIAFGLLFPERVVTLFLFFFLPVRMRARQMVVIFIGLELLFLLGREGGGGIAHFAHLGGALVGYIYLKWPFRWRGFRPRPPAASEPGFGMVPGYRRELDSILEKLARQGWGGLNEEEKDFLYDGQDNL